MPSKIEWTGETWNPVRARLLSDPSRVGWHCTHASAGCLKCYAETMNKRGIGTGLAYKPGNEKLIEIFLDEKVIDKPRHWRDPRTIFAGSMTDLFAPFVSDLMLDRIMAIPAETPRHTFQFLTKRPDRMGEYIRRLWSCGQHALAHVSDSAECFPRENCWMGTSVEDARVLHRIDELRKVPAHIRFLSIEPLIGPLPNLDLRGIHWVIVGGESGNGARPMHPDWVRSIRDQCAAAGVAFFFKQWGEWRPFEPEGLDPDLWWVVYPNGVLDSPDLTGRLYDGAAAIRRVGKRAAGRHLDGRLHDEMPRLVA